MKRHVPDLHTDFIYSVAAEEYGLIFSLVLILLYAFLVIRGLSKAMKLSDTFQQVAAAGLFVLVGEQVFINIAVNLNLIPTKGMTLPFISYGGSSLVPTLAGVGILLNISQYAALGKRAAYEDDSEEEGWPEEQRPKKRQAPRQRARAVARARYG